MGACTMLSGVLSVHAPALTALTAVHFVQITPAPAYARILQPELVRVSPDVVPAGSRDIVVGLIGRALTSARAVRFRDCTGDTATVRFVGAARPTVRVPARMLRSPCVLRVWLGGSMRDLPLVVADPALLTLPTPARPDPNDFHPWTGMFDTLCELDTTAAPSHRSVVAVFSDSAVSEPFVLGKNGHAVMRLASVRPQQLPISPGGSCQYVLLPGVEPADVQWGPHDIERFWIGTLTRGGRTIRDRQFLSDMVIEPSGPPDHD
ncbi:MAG: hypothetical protein ACREOJ_04305 [Gemmatimonadaceae bacterium]